MTVDDTPQMAAGSGKEHRPEVRLSVVAAVVVLVVFLMVVGYSFVASTAGRDLEPHARPEAVDFTGAAFTGEEIRLTALRGQPVVVNFWASWCSPCRTEAPDLERVWQAYRDRGIAFLGVDIQDTESAARTFLDELRISYPNIHDARNDIARAYQVAGIPSTVFIDRDGRVASRWTGPINQQQLVARLDELLN